MNGIITDESLFGMNGIMKRKPKDTNKDDGDALPIGSGSPSTRTGSWKAKTPAGACPSNTHPQTRQEGGSSSLSSSQVISSYSQGVFNIDWWESAGCIVWSNASKAVFDEFEKCAFRAEECRQLIVSTYGDGQILVHSRGLGTGHGSRLEFRLEWRGVTIALSARSDATRQLSNFYLKVPGEACLLIGFDNVREIVEGWIRAWGGELQDEWVRRLDICLDVPNLNLREKVYPACLAMQYVSTVKGDNCNRLSGDWTGFTIGKSPGTRLNIYDKVAELKHKSNELYTLAMIERRWGGTMPEAAARVEYQLHREFLQQFEGMNSAAAVILKLPDIVERLVQTEQRPFFKLTDAVPDREGRHQDRAEILPEWAAIIQMFREGVGKPTGPLKRLDRGLIDAKRAVMSAIGYITSAAAQLEIVVEGSQDVLFALEELMRRNDISDELIAQKYLDKARRYGTLNEPCEFPFGSNLAA